MIQSIQINFDGLCIKKLTQEVGRSLFANQKTKPLNNLQINKEAPSGTLARKIQKNKNSNIARDMVSPKELQNQ